MKEVFTVPALMTEVAGLLFSRLLGGEEGSLRCRAVETFLPHPLISYVWTIHSTSSISVWKRKENDVHKLDAVHISLKGVYRFVRMTVHS